MKEKFRKGEIAEEWSTEEDVREALRRWQDAEMILNEASDPELIEYAIFDAEAARRRYSYVLSKYRAEQ